MELLISFSLLANLIVHSNAADGTADPVLRLPFFNSQEMKSCKTKKTFRYLNKDQKKKIALATGFKEVQGFYPVYHSTCEKVTRFTYILNDIVRSEYQTLLISMMNHKIDHLEVIRFDEPRKYKAPDSWFQSFRKDKNLDKIDAISGATLTRASTLKLAKLAKQLDLIKDEKN